MPVIRVSPNSQGLPVVFFFHLVSGTRPFFSSSKSFKCKEPYPNFLAVSAIRSTPNNLATS